MKKCNPSSATRKPPKPHPDFPLYAHAAGVWAKKIKQKLHYFGPWDDPQAALERYLAVKDDLLAGRTPRPKTDGFALRDLANSFLTAKKHLAETGEITARTYGDYYNTCQQVITILGKDKLLVDLRGDDFDHLRRCLSKTRGPVALANEIGRVRMLCKFGYDAGIIDRPVRYGASFKRPSKKVIRIARAKDGPRMFEAPELRAILEAASMPIRAMAWLGINCGFGNADCATLPIKALDLQSGWVRFPRPKTGIDRRCPLWPDTVAALQEAIASRPSPKNTKDAELVFVTKYGQKWSKDTKANPISAEFRKLLVKLGLHRNGLGFYALRHAFETIGGDSRDQVAVDFIMGHSRNDMASAYRERIDDARLLAVTEHVRKWLFGEQK
ncbi:MAG: tyrosine-type recombinase/integrase [Thermoguttaceae bacterium]